MADDDDDLGWVSDPHFTPPPGMEWMRTGTLLLEALSNAESADDAKRIIDTMDVREMRAVIMAHTFEQAKRLRLNDDEFIAWVRKKASGEATS